MDTFFKPVVIIAQDFLRHQNKHLCRKTHTNHLKQNSYNFECLRATVISCSMSVCPSVCLSVCLSLFQDVAVHDSACALKVFLIRARLKHGRLLKRETRGYK